MLLDAEALMRDEGYAAVTSRRVAATASLKPMTGATQVLVQERIRDIPTGHDETMRFAERWPTFLEGDVRSTTTGGSQPRTPAAT